ncbi:uncharacterized protein LOC141660546 [Apium graveolens]|uniref:uncharacterized protein LOC141660546 n=1 Tax=Apium graveolens TaxID=4045 RepID=UPI003D79CD8D
MTGISVQLGHPKGGPYLDTCMQSTQVRRPPPPTINNPDQKRYYQSMSQNEMPSVQSENLSEPSIHNRQQNHEEFNVDELPIDPAMRKNIYDLNANDREKIRRFYLQKGPCQPNIIFPWRMFGAKKRRFVLTWYKEHPSWLEYSVSEDSVYCLCCYLFKPEHGGQSGGDVFITQGFTNWKEALKKSREHVGEDSNNIHKKLCLSQALAFRGHNESEESNKKGNFLTFLQFLADHNEEIKRIVLDKAPDNNKLSSPDIQKDVVKAMAIETTKIILRELGEDLFSILVDESRDISVKEKMVILLRYVNKSGCIVERFLGVVHVGDTTSLSLKFGVEELLQKHQLSITRIRGQGYDGASNMQGKFNGLKSLILKDNPCAFYENSFAHQLQLALVDVVRKHRKISMFFTQLNTITNVVDGSCKLQDLLRDKQTSEVIEVICSGQIPIGKGLNQESTLKCAGDTRWGSYYTTLLSLIRLFNPAITVLEHIVEHTDDHDLRGNAELMLSTMNKFDFIFLFHLMKNIMGISDGLSRALQKKDQDIVNAMNLVNVTKNMLRSMRTDGWESFL